MYEAAPISLTKQLALLARAKKARIKAQKAKNVDEYFRERESEKFWEWAIVSHIQQIIKEGKEIDNGRQKTCRVS